MEFLQPALREAPQRTAAALTFLPGRGGTWVADYVFVPWFGGRTYGKEEFLLFLSFSLTCRHGVELGVLLRDLPRGRPLSELLGGQNRPLVERCLPLCLGLFAPCKSRQQEGTRPEVVLQSYAFLGGGQGCSAGSLRAPASPHPHVGLAPQGSLPPATPNGTTPVGKLGKQHKLPNIHVYF